ncbi:hypothetical protein PoB_007457900 [Plakobranchus ocellatus]|uniref:Uncharacterized protein n=1 Tax=Plakobranchus ocellatus TaxID=259542 RepID=A0AAV4DVM6_9GAST|nr:hypothetical protein PoB_007457900 [Plakobranchus ocellatus]
MENKTVAVFCMIVASRVPKIVKLITPSTQLQQIKAVLLMARVILTAADYQLMQKKFSNVETNYYAPNHKTLSCRPLVLIQGLSPDDPQKLS